MSRALPRTGTFWARRLLRGAGWALLARTLALPIGLLQAMLLTRLLPPAEVGGYFLAISLIVVLAMVAQFGMSRPMVKLVASALAIDRPQAARHAIRVTLLSTLAGGVVLALAVADGLGNWLSATLEGGGVLRPVWPIIAVMILAFALNELTAETLRGFHDLRAASAFGDNLAQRMTLALILSTIWFAGWSADLTTVLIASLVAATLMLSLALGQLARQVAAIGRYGARWRTAEVLGHGLPFLLMRLNFWFSAGADLWVLGMFRPPDEVAVYGTASRLALLVSFPLTVCNSVLAPAIAELYSRNELERAEKAIRAAATLGVVPSILLMAVFLVFGDRLLGAFFDTAYSEGYWVLAILAIGQCVGVGFGACTLALTMTGHQRDVMAVSTVVAAGVILAFYLAAAPYGAHGVAVVAALSLILYNVVLAGLVRWRLRMVTWSTFSPATFRRFATELRRALDRAA
jgi:O-antigen/teichoic acid export membrane protein